MGLTMKRVCGRFGDKARLARINADAFPPVERMGVGRILELSAKDCFDLLAAYDGGVLVGFTLLGVGDSCAYIFLLAVDKARQSRGYGSRILEELGRL